MSDTDERLIAVAVDVHKSDNDVDVQPAQPRKRTQKGLEYTLQTKLET